MPKLLIELDMTEEDFEFAKEVLSNAAACNSIIRSSLREKLRRRGTFGGTRNTQETIREWSEVYEDQMTVSRSRSIRNARLVRVVDTP